MPAQLSAEVKRGPRIESRHRGVVAVANDDGDIIHAAGDISAPIYPRSAIKALQALPVIESGAAARFGFDEAEIALACSSHNGEPMHVETARNMLQKAGIPEPAYECGAHPPFNAKAAADLIRASVAPQAVHNNCSGKHAAMLALARHLDAPLENYVSPDHPVQQQVAQTISQMCSFDVSQTIPAIDGCSVPTWAIPLQNIARCLAKFSTGKDLSQARGDACRQIINAARHHPELIAGTDRFCSNIMRAVPRLFVKTGAEGVFCAAIPHAGLGITLKCLDGATRASEPMLAAVLYQLDCWRDEERRAIKDFTTVELKNVTGKIVGSISGVFTLD